MVKASKDYATGYAQVDPEMLCQRCEHGRLSEGRQGRTEVTCGAQGLPRPVRFVVTKCSTFDKRRMRIPQFVAEPIVLMFERGVLLRWDRPTQEWTPVTPGTPKPESASGPMIRVGTVQ